MGREDVSGSVSCMQAKSNIGPSSPNSEGEKVTPFHSSTVAHFILTFAHIECGWHPILCEFHFAHDLNHQAPWIACCHRWDYGGRMDVSWVSATVHPRCSMNVPIDWLCISIDRFGFTNQTIVRLTSFLFRSTSVAPWIGQIFSVLRISLFFSLYGTSVAPYQNLFENFFFSDFPFLFPLRYSRRSISEFFFRIFFPFLFPLRYMSHSIALQIVGLVSWNLKGIMVVYWI